ncbi:MAG: RdgB/HAM1 family non-canonical purine NTP pyrophosphatase [Opitutaceae bacterium]
MKLFLASGNRHKLGEVAAILRDAGLTVDLNGADAIGGMPDVDEDAGSFAGNARKKARALADRVPAGSWVLADDSGLCVDFLKGAPGVISSRFAGPDASDCDNTRLLLERLSGIPEAERSAHFRCVLILLGPDGEEALFDGRCHGRIAAEPSGYGGFGYDPVFVPDGHSVSFAELDADAKNRISHRAVALAQMVDWLLQSSPSETGSA